MQIFLMWHKGIGRGRSLDPLSVAKRLGELFAPLFTQAPVSRIIENDAACFVYLERPVEHFIPAFLEERDGDWALAVQYPGLLPLALKAAGLPHDPHHPLLSLAGALRSRPETVLRELAPMFTLVWSARDSQEVHIQNDGLGQSQMFECHRDGLWALGNRMMALSALGIDLQPEPCEWAVRMTTDWMPLAMTGFKGVTYLEPGTRLHLTPAGIERRRYDVVGDWIRPLNLSRRECLDMACESFQGAIRASAPLWKRARVGLTGGRDSRAVASALLREGVDNVYYAVRGGEKSPDVLVARKLAGIAGIDLAVRHRAMQSPADAEGLRRCLKRALLWQAGYVDIRQHDSFMSRTDDLGGGEVNVMGQHGEIGRGYFIDRLGVDRLKPHQYEDALVRFMLFQNTPTHAILRSDHLEFIRETVKQACRQADPYGLEGLDRLDFFYLYERTRRWASAGNNIQPGQIISPFLNPGFVRAVYNYPARERGGDPFHQEIISRNMPRWAKVIYDDEQEARSHREKIRNAKKRSRVQYYRNRVNGWILEKYKDCLPRHISPDRLGKWGREGKILIDEVLESDGFWTEVFDPALARKYWFRAPEQLVVTDGLARLLDDPWA